MTDKPKPTSSLAEKELDKVENHFKEFDKQVKSLTLYGMNTARQADQEQQTKIAQVDMSKQKDVYLKPFRSIGSREKFNEGYREEWRFSTEYVNFIAENKEIIGEEIDMWTKPFAGMPAEEWKVPVNKSVWAPRHVAEQIKRSRYHRLSMQQSQSAGQDHSGQYFGTMVADTTVQRLDAIPVSSHKSVFMGSANF